MTFTIRFDEMPAELIDKFVELMEDDGLPDGAFKNGYPKRMYVTVLDEDIGVDTTVSLKGGIIGNSDDLFEPEKYKEWLSKADAEVESIKPHGNAAAVATEE